MKIFRTKKAANNQSNQKQFRIENPKIYLENQNPEEHFIANMTTVIEFMLHVLPSIFTLKQNIMEVPKRREMLMQYYNLSIQKLIALA